LAAWVLFGTMTLPVSAQVLEEAWAKGSGSAQEAFNVNGVRRVGVLLAAVDGKPGYGSRYSTNSLLTYDREFDTSPHRLTESQELYLYEEIREALVDRGFEVTLLNLRPWKGQRLSDIAAGEPGVDAVLAVNYAARRSHAIMDVQEDTWWSPFEGVRITAHSALFKTGTGDLIYSQKTQGLGTVELYRQRGERMGDEVFFGKGSNNEYTATVYKTSVYDLPLKQRGIPVIRTPKGSIDISFVQISAAESFRMRGLYDRLRESNDPDTETGTVKRSLLQRLLRHTEYKAFEEDVRTFERMSIKTFGEAFAGALPSRS